MYKLHIKQLLRKGKEAEAREFLYGAWRALYETMGADRGTLYLLQRIDIEHWDLLPSAAMCFLIQRFLHDHIDDTVQTDDGK